MHKLRPIAGRIGFFGVGGHPGFFGQSRVSSSNTGTRKTNDFRDFEGETRDGPKNRNCHNGWKTLKIP